MSAQTQLGLFSRSIRSLGGTGILNSSDMHELGAGVVRVYDLMRDGAWHTRADIEIAAGINGTPAAEGLRRMRELRKFFWIERRRGDGRVFEYRLEGSR